MKINALLTERAIIQEQILTDSTYKTFYKLGVMLREYNMSQQQIQQVFQQVSDGAAAGGNVDKEGDAPASNRTVLGKGADVAGKVADAYRGLKQAIGQTGPVKGIDAMIDSAQGQIMQAAGGEAGKVGQALEFYRELSRVPGMAMAVKIAVLGLAGLAGSGLGPIGIAAGLTFANKMLQGDEFSSAVMGAMETGGTVAAIQTAKDLLTTTRVGADYGDADDQSFGEIPKTPDPNDLSNVDPNNIYRPTPTEPAGPSDAANAAYDQNPDPSTGLPLDPNSSRSDYTTPDSADDVTPATAEYKVTAADGKLGVGGIAQKYPGVSAQDIIDYNDLPANGLIKPGQVLQIPEPNVVSPASTNVWDRYEGPTNNMSQSQADALSDRAGNLNRAQDLANPAEPVVPGTPSDGSYRQSAPLGADGKPMKQMASKINTGNMIREYIDIDTTARMWILHESLGKPRGGVYLSEAGVQAVFKEVARRSVVNEGPMLDKLKGFNQKANAFIGKATAPIKQAAAAGWDSATNKITYADLDRKWRRSAKLDKEASVDSAEVAKFLKSQGVKDPLINSSFAALKLASPLQSQAAGQSKYNAGEEPFSVTNAIGQGVADTLSGASDAIERGRNAYIGGSVADQKHPGKGNGLEITDRTGKRTKYVQSGDKWFTQDGKEVDPATAAMLSDRAAQQATSTTPNKSATTSTSTTPRQPTEQPPAVWKNNRTPSAPSTTSPQATEPKQQTTQEPAKATQEPATADKPTTAATPSTAFKLPQATSSTVGQPSKVTYDPKMFAKKAAAPNFNALSNAASKGYKTAQPTVAPTMTRPAAPVTPTTKVTTGGPTPDERAKLDQRIKQIQQRQAQTAPVAESRVDFGAMLFNKMKKQS